MPTIYRAMGLDAASNRYPPDIQHGRHTKDSCLRSDKFSSQPPLASEFLGGSSCHYQSSIGRDWDCCLWVCLTNCCKYPCGEDSVCCQACEALRRDLLSTASNCNMQALLSSKAVVIAVEAVPSSWVKPSHDTRPAVNDCS